MALPLRAAQTMFAVVELITPKRAAALLKTMHPDWQRRLRSLRVREYVAERLAGGWVLTHQGIAIDVNGVLRDGQHRLEMIVETGLATEMLVVYNVPLEACAFMDDMLPRSAKDAIRMAAGGDFSNQAIAIANAMVSAPEISSQRVSRRVIMERLTRFAEPIGFVISRMERVRCMTRGVQTLIARAWYSAPRDRLDAFVGVLVTGLYDGPEDQAAVVYRNYLLRQSPNVGRTIESEKYRKGQTALDSFLKRAPITKIYGTNTDMYPLPDGLA